MCCSSGRIDALKSPKNYQMPLPIVRDSSEPSPETEDPSIAIINEMVRYAAIMRRASKDIYHDAKNRTLVEKARVALAIDDSLEEWKRGLPEWLQLDAVSLRESEWSGKQKLVLQLRMFFLCSLSYVNGRVSWLVS